MPAAPKVAAPVSGPGASGGRKRLMASEGGIRGWANKSIDRGP